jgi:hypothetical protein
MRLVSLALALLLPLTSLAKDPACAKKCDELLKSMAAECRRDEGGKHKGEDGHDDAAACQANLKKLRVACLKDCAQEPKRKR